MQTLSDHLIHPEFSALQRAYLRRLEVCSPFVSRMLAKDANLLEDLLKNLHIPYTLEAVSYTHLDVYKRQQHTSSATVERCLERTSKPGIVFEDQHG